MESQSRCAREYIRLGHDFFNWIARDVPAVGYLLLYSLENRGSGLACFVLGRPCISLQRQEDEAHSLIVLKVARVDKLPHAKRRQV